MLLLRRHKRLRRGFSLLEVTVVMVVLAVITAVAIPTYSGVLQRASDKAHLASLSNIASAVAATYADGRGTQTWLDALSKVASSSSIAAGVDSSGQTILAAATLVTPTAGASTATDTISYALTPAGATPVVPGTSLGLASQNKTGTCSMVTVGDSGVTASWITGKLGANCTGTNALLGPTASKAMPYVLPADFGAPHPVILSTSISQNYDSTSATIAGPTFTLTPSTSTDVASIQVTRNGIVIATLPADSTTYTDSTALSGTTYNYSFTAVDTSGLHSTPATITVTTKPGALTNGTLTYLLSSGLANATLSWSAPSSAESVSGYHIYRNGALIDVILGSSTTTAVINGQALGIPYTYDILPYNSAGDGLGFEVPVTFITTAAPPVTITATASNAQVALTWPTVTSTSAAPVTGYFLYRSAASGPYLFLNAVVGQSISTYTDTTAANGVPYSYEVSSYGPRGAGPVSTPSAVVTPIAPPAAGTLGTPGLGTDTLTFSISFPSTAAAPVDHLVIKRNGVTLDANYSASATSYTDSTIVTDAVYTYSVYAVNSAGVSPTATTASTTIALVPAAPILGPPTAGVGQVALTWTPLTPTVTTPVAGYRIYSSTGGAYTLVAQIPGVASSSYTDHSVTNGSTYTYQIESYGSGGTSARSLTSAAVTPYAAPLTPVITSALPALGGASVNLNFTTSPTSSAPVTSITINRNGSLLTTLASSASSYTDSSVVTGTPYTYTVIAHNSVAQTSSSPSATITPYGIASIPTFTTTSAADSQATLNWNRVTSTVGTPVTGYRLYRSVSGGAFTLDTQIIGETNLTYTDTGLTNGVTYSYELTAYGAGGESTYSSPVTLYPVAIPAPVTITSSAPVLGGGSIVINFTTAPTTTAPITYITVDRNGSLYATLLPSATSELDGSVTNGTAYTYTITTHNALYSSTAVTTSPITAYAIAATPSFTSVTPSTSVVYLNWSQVASTVDTPVAGYRLYRSVSGGAFTLLTQVIGSTTTSYADTSAINGTDYAYQISAYGAGGESTISAASATVRPLAAPPTPVINSAVTALGGGSITVNFSTVSTTPAPVTTITVTRNGVPYLTLPATSTTFTDATVINGTAYSYAITAGNQIASSAAATTSLLVPYAVPAAPTFLTTTPSDSQVSLSWTTITGTVGVPVTGYRLYSSVNGGSYTLLAVQSGTTYTDTSVSNGNNYSYRVETYGAGGTSAQTTSTTVTPIGAPITAPTLLASASDSQVALSWNSITSTLARPVNGYLLQSSSVSASGPWSTLYTGASLSYTNTSLTNGNTYYFRVAATNTVSGVGVGVYSSTQAATPIAIPATPVGLATTQGNGVTNLTWTPDTSSTAAPVSGYRIYSATAAAGPYTLVNAITPATASSYTDSSVSAGATYWYEIEAYGTAGTSPRSSYTPSLGITAITTPTTPPTLTPTESSGQVLLNWSAVTPTTAQPVTGYSLQRSAISTSGPWSSIYTGAALTYTDTSTSNGTTYYYQVAATNAVGNGAYSTALSTTPIGIPVAPPAPNAVQGNNQINLSWTALTTTAATPVTGYQIFRAVGSPSGFTLLQTVIGASSSTATDTSVTAGTTYYYQINGYNANGAGAASSVFPSSGVVDITTPTATSVLTPAAADSQVALSWTAVTPTTAQPVTGYILQSSTTSATGPWSTIYSGPALTYTNTSLINGNTYYYQIAAQNLAGAGTYSTPAVSATPLAIPAAPLPPVPTQGNGVINLTWAPDVSTSGAPVAGYRIYRATASTGPFTLFSAITPATANSTTDSTVTAGVTYWYQIEAYGTAGTSARSANSSSITDITAPSTPPTLSITSGSTQNAVTWPAVTATLAQPVTGYVLQQSSTSASGPWSTIYTGPSLGYTATSLTNGTTYYYQAATTNLVGSSPYSSPATAGTPLGVPAQVVGTTATQIPSALTLGWTALTPTASTPVTGYHIYRATALAGPYTLVTAVVGASTTTFTDSTGTVGTTYWYQIVGYNANGEGIYSAYFPAAGVAVATVPSTPVLTTPTVVSGTTITLPITATAVGAPITAYNITANPAITLSYSGTTSPLTITAAFASGVSYAFVATATNAVGTSPQSAYTSTVSPLNPPSVSGGTLTNDGTYYYDTFTSSGTFTVTGGSLATAALVVSGGGGGASYGNGGSGGGYSATTPTLTAGSYPIVVGTGGAGTASNSAGSNGTASSFNGVSPAAGVGGAYTGAASYGGAACGGALSTNHGGMNGTTWLNGTTYCGGGGDGGYSAGYAGTPAGTGGGGHGYNTTTCAAPYIGVANTGGGGGGGNLSSPSCPGGSGVVVIRFLMSAAVPAASAPVTGGTLTNDGTYYYNTFTSSSTLTIASGNSVSVNYLIVGGGGGGAGYAGGGGGAGGYLTGTTTLSAGSYPVVVGTGGLGGTGLASYTTYDTPGTSSTFNSLTALGGGQGGTYTNNSSGFGGGSGGGSAYNSGVGGNGTAGQGNNGGTYSGSFAGGGGGAGGVGTATATPGAGLTWLNGVTYAVGGGGASTTASYGTAPGGLGGNSSTTSATSATANSGSGGGGTWTVGTGGNGGSGIVIVRYLMTAVSSGPVQVSPPSNVAAAQSGTNVNITWTAPGGNTFGYKIYRSTALAGPYTLLTQVVPGTATSYLDNAVSLGTTYYYQIQSYNGSSTSAATAIFPSSGITPIGPPLSPPATFTATATATTVTLNWSAAATSAANPATSYTLQQSTTSSSGPWSTVYTGTALTSTQSSLTNGTTYYYQLFVTNSQGQSSSDSLSIVAIGSPAAVTGYAAVQAASQINLSWTALTSTASIPVTGYNIYRATSTAGPFLLQQTVTGAASASATDATGTLGTTYYYEIAAYNANGIGVQSTYFPTPGVVDIGLPGAPGSISATATSTTTTINWTAATNTTANPVTGYLLKQSPTSASGPWTTVYSGALLTSTQSSLIAGTTYYYQLFATNAVGNTITPLTISIPAIGAPATVTGAGATQGNSLVNLSWTALTSTVAVPVTGYQITRATALAGPYTLQQTVTGASTATAQDATVTPGTTYYYEINAYNANGAGPISAAFPGSGILAIATPIATTVPTPYNGNAQSLINWNAVTPTTAYPVTGYILQQSSTSSTGPWTTIYTGPLLTYTSTGLTNGVVYYFQIAATNSVGTGTYSAATSVLPQATPLVPTGLNATAAPAGASITWTPVSNTATYTVNGYNIYYATATGGPYTLLQAVTPQSANSYSATGLTVGTTYYFEITAYSSSGPSAYSAYAPSSGVIPTGVPIATSTITPTAGDTQLILNWTAVSAVPGRAVTGYVLQRSPDGSTGWTTLYRGSNLTYTDTGLTDGTTYYYHVAATNSVGDGAGSVVVSATPITTPAVITGLSTSGAAPSVTATWSAATSTSAAPVTGVDVLLNGSVVTTLAANATSYTYSSGLATGVAYPGNTYTFSVRPKNAVATATVTSLSEKLFTANTTTPTCNSGGTYQNTGAGVAGSCGIYQTGGGYYTCSGGGTYGSGGAGCGTYVSTAAYYSCDGGGSWNGSNCGTYQSGTTYSCPSGGSLSGTICITTFGSTYGSSHLNYSCPNGGTLSGSTCLRSPTSGGNYAATNNQYCPSGGTLSGTTCTIAQVSYGATGTPVYSSYPGGTYHAAVYSNYPAPTYISPTYANYPAATANYACSNSGTLAGTECSL